MTQPLARRIAYQKARIERLTGKIGALMSQRADEEEKLAELLDNSSQEVARGVRNPDVEGTGQPFIATQPVVLEKRTPSGALDFSAPQPPTHIQGEPHKGWDQTRDLTLNDVYDMFFKECPEAPGSWKALRAWLDSKGWVIRAKTW